MASKLSLEKRVTHLEEIIESLRKQIYGEAEASASMTNVKRETLVNEAAQTPVPDGTIRPPIPDEEWAPKVAVDMTKPTESAASLEDELMSRVYGQNRVTLAKEP